MIVGHRQNSTHSTRKKVQVSFCFFLLGGFDYGSLSAHSNCVKVKLGIITMSNETLINADKERVHIVSANNSYYCYYFNVIIATLKYFIINE